MPTIETNGIETYYERLGQGRPVVFVHGAAVDRNAWRPQIDGLANEYDVVAYDLRGHGLTGGSPRDRYSMELFADDLAALIEGLDLADPVVCGHSTGGCVAQVYADRHPEALAGLVLADTFTPEVLSRADWLQRKALLATIPPVRLLGYERVERAKNWLHERFQPGATGNYGTIEALRAEGPLVSTNEFAKVIRAVARFEESHVDLSRMTAPTLVVYGENELGFVREHAARLGARLPNVSLLAVPDAGHASNLDAPEFVTDALREFLTTTVGDAAGRSTDPRELTARS